MTQESKKKEREGKREEKSEFACFFPKFIIIAFALILFKFLIQKQK